MKTSNGFMMKDLTKILGIRMSSLQQWIDRGFVAPSIEKASGPGSRNIWSREDLISLAVFKELLDQGFTREEASSLVKCKNILEVRQGEVLLREKVDFTASLAILGLAVYAMRLVDDKDEVHGVLFGIAFPVQSVIGAMQDVSSFMGITGKLRQIMVADVTDTIEKVFGAVY